MSNVTEYVSGFPETTELRKTSTANAFVTVSYSYEMEYEVLRKSFFPYSYINGLNPAAVGDFSSLTREIVHRFRSKLIITKVVSNHERMNCEGHHSYLNTSCMHYHNNVSLLPS